MGTSAIELPRRVAGAVPHSAQATQNLGARRATARTFITHIVVVIPARDEQETIARAIASVVNASQGYSVDIIVVADGCSDETEIRAKQALCGGGAVVRGNWRCVGAARRVGVAFGLIRSPAADAQTWIASTDADGVVPPDWLTIQLQLAEEEAVAVAGIVDLACESTADHMFAERFAATYETYDDGSHPHVHAANMGVRADAYLAVGGWPRAHRSEDRLLWTRLESAGYNVVSTVDLSIRTSARRQGRVPLGFAASLASLATLADEKAEATR